jgi:two-component system phosphate regulon sensor histidine kinase PhoR
MTITQKRVGLASAAVIVIAAAAAYCTLGVLGKNGPVAAPQATFMLMALVGVLAGLVIAMFWRSLHAAVRAIASQLENMTKSGQIGLVMTEASGEMEPVTRRLNEFLSNMKQQIDSLRGENRELQIQSRIASAEKQHTEAIIFSISDAVIVTNRFDEMVLANEAAEQLLGFELATGLRKNIDRIISDGTLVRLIRETRAHGKGMTRRVVEHAIDSKGAPRVFSITLSCVVAATDEVSGVVAVLHDVTREKEISRMKTDFVSNVSHELKTPLASIKAYVEMLIDGEAQDAKTQREFYEIIQSETDRLHRLIENILNISRIESGVVKVVKEPVNIVAIAKQAVEVALPQARAKNQTIHERLSPVFQQVEADRDMLYQAVLNLLSNAIKYTPDGGQITVDVSVDERRGLAVCSVADTGAGIPPDDLPHIFDKFYRVRANSRMAKGTGLGLTMVKHIIETVHDGKITVTSEQGKGSTFCFELPVMN